MVSPTRTPFSGAGSLGGRSRRMFILPPVALFPLLLASQLQRSTRSLPPVCPASDSKPARIFNLTLGEEIIRLRPDFIPASSINNAENLKSTQALGCRMLAVSGFESIAAVRRNVMKIAAALGETVPGGTRMEFGRRK